MPLLPTRCVSCLLSLLVLAALLSACAPVAETPLPPPVEAPHLALLPAEIAAPTCLAAGPFPPLLPGLRYGINAFLFHTDSARVLTLAESAQFGWLRQQIHWRDIEVGPDHYAWGTLDQAIEAAEARRFQILLTVVQSPVWDTQNGGGGLPDDPARIGAFMAALAERYAGRVSAYEIWNEPNLAVENGGVVAQPAHYLATLQAAYAAVKAADPCALVLAAPMAATATNDPALAMDDLAFYQALYELEDGAFLRAADVLALHPGGGPHAYDARWPARAPERSRFYFRHIEQIYALMQQHGDQRQAWITEVGWATSHAPGAPTPVSDEQQAHNLRGVLELTRERYPWITAVFVWNLNFSVLGPADDEKSTFGILNPDWSPRPAYMALQEYLAARAASESDTLPQFSAAAPFRYGWHFNAAGKLHTPTLIAADGTIYITSDPGTLSALAPAGGVRWQFSAPAPTTFAPAHAADGMLYLGDSSGHLTALSPDGTQRWQVALGAPLGGTPQLAADGLLLVTNDERRMQDSPQAAQNELIKIDYQGHVLWRMPLDGPGAPPLLAESVLYAPTRTGNLLAFDATSGARIWRATLGTRITSAPTLSHDGQRILVGDADGYLHSVDAATGRTIWRHKLVQRILSESVLESSPLISAPPLVTSDGTIYLGGRDGLVTALAAEGQVLWRYNTGSDITVTPTRGADGLLYIGTYDKRLIALNLAGEPAWQVRLRGAVRSQPTTAADGTLYVNTLGGILYAFTPTGMQATR